jgi:rSAM/selenodomain-associated transferase 2
MMDRPTRSVIIPVYREQSRIGLLLESLAALTDGGATEILVVDGEPEQGTLDQVPPGLAIGLRAPRGRARQMNAGAAVAHGEVFLFLHADTRLPPGALAAMDEALADPGTCGGAFRLRIVPENGRPGPWLRLITWAANLRTRLTRVPYGDQAIFLRRDCFEALGGFADLPLMEDLELMTRLRRSGRAIRILETAVETSARRWEREGVLLCTARNVFVRLCYHLGVPTGFLARLYQ